MLASDASFNYLFFFFWIEHSDWNLWISVTVQIGIRPQFWIGGQAPILCCLIRTGVRLNRGSAPAVIKGRVSSLCHSFSFLTMPPSVVSRASSVASKLSDTLRKVSYEVQIITSTYVISSRSFTATLTAILDLPSSTAILPSHYRK
jgi:hypothetical protein